MSITPLDLQTMFVRLNVVGKEQNTLKEAVASQQAAGAKQIKENELRQDNSVNKLEEDHEAQMISDEENQNQEGQKESGNEKEKDKTLVKKAVFKDPEMGSHIDISG
jgi:hypothetical protein